MAALSALAAGACVAGDDPSVPVEPVPTEKPSVRLFAPSDSTRVGAVFRLEAPPPGGIISPGDTVPRWHSSDTLVAIVDSLGEVTAVAAGTARIAAEFDTWQAVVDLDVSLREPLPGLRFQSGSLGLGRTCAISDGRVYCGTQRYGTSQIDTFAEMPGAADIRFQKVSTSLHAVCALAEDGRILCWGNNAHFLFARRGRMTTDTGPVALGTDLRFSDFVHNGHAQSCATERDSGVMHCIGHHDRVVLLNGQPNYIEDTIMRPVLGRPTPISMTTANFHTCFVDPEGRAMCGGGSTYAFGMSPPAALVDSPTHVATSRRFRSITAADQTTCGLDREDRAWCWGSNANGLFGDGTPSDASLVAIEPRAVGGGMRFREIQVVYPQRACGITIDDAFVCWGNSGGTWRARLGDRALWPSPVSTRHEFRSLAGFYCAITTDGRLLCV